MKLYIVENFFGAESSAAPTYRALADDDMVGVHSVIDDSAGADAVVFPDCHLAESTRLWPLLAGSELFERHRDKFYVVDERDRPWCELPGLYTSMPQRRFRPAFQAPCAYHVTGDPRRRLPALADDKPDLLFSFVGSPTHRCREQLFSLDHPRAHVERVDGFMFWDPSSANFAERGKHFAEVMLRSKFVLCPRGHGTSSIRFYETLAAGRVPVVIADDWLPPFDIDTSAFALRWPEGTTEGLIEMLEAEEPRASELGTAARETYETYFAPNVRFHHIAEAIARLHERRPWDSFRSFGYPDTDLLRRQVRVALRSAKQLIPRGRRNRGAT